MDGKGYQTASVLLLWKATIKPAPQVRLTAAAGLAQER